MSHHHLRWKERRRERLLDAAVFSVDKSIQEGPEGRSAEYFLLNTPDWGNVVALTTDEQGRECFVMVRQFRHGNMKVSLEFPGGVIDPGEDPKEATARELAEETGYTSEEFTLIGEIYPNPAFMNNVCYTYLARGLRRIRDQNLDENEVIDVELVPVDSITVDLQGSFFHAMMVVALHFYNCWRADHPTP
ncbi:MAG: NUDIX hydrolase [Alkalispirochaetaceae bacterium]